MNFVALYANIIQMSEPLDSLNPDQQAAVISTDGPNLILAGAGSGKTRVLTHKVAYLIGEKHVPPQSILVWTFTNKAAEEMKNRIFTLLNLTPDNQHLTPIMGTFHSLCARFLRTDGFQIGLSKSFVIYDETDALEAIKLALKNLSMDPKKLNPSAVRHTISSAKNEMITPIMYPALARGFFQEQVAKVYTEYTRILTKNQALDFDDLLLTTIRLFTEAPHILTAYQDRFRYILVDEYQDTNAVQYKLVKLLAASHHNITVVGDAAQSIYSFRGADFRNIVNFRSDYPDVKVFNLEQNYRSTQNILDAAYAVISSNKSHPILKLWTDNLGGEKITLFEARTEVDEANFLAEQIQSLSNSKLASSAYTLSDFAILYRTNAQSRVLEEAFLRYGITYKLVGGVQFYERKEIKDILAFLRLIQNPQDSISINRIEKIGKGRSRSFYSYRELLIDKSNTLPTSERETETINIPTLELLDGIVSVTNYFDYLDDGTDTGANKIDNVKELRSVAEEFPNLSQFLENVALVQDAYTPTGRLKKSKDTNAVTLMTIHAAKGLEFPIVFIVGLEEGLFPHSRSLMNPGEMEEERRLAYVAITRAKHKLFMTYTRSRLFFGTRSNNLVSRFLSSIPENLLENNLSSHSFTDDIYPSPRQFAKDEF